MKFKSKCKKSKTVNGFVTGVIVGGIIFGGIGVAAVTLTADQIKYTTSDSKFKVTNAKEALDEIYKISEYEIPVDTYFYDSSTSGEGVVRYKKVDGKYYECNENGIVEDNASEVNITGKNLVAYTSFKAKNLSIGSAGYASGLFHLGNGSDSMDSFINFGQGEYLYRVLTRTLTITANQDYDKAFLIIDGATISLSSYITSGSGSITHIPHSVSELQIQGFVLENIKQGDIITITSSTDARFDYAIYF